MKKPYIKPKVEKLEIDSDVVRMFTRQGFIDLFWEHLQEARKKKPATSQEEIFNNLNDRWFKAMGNYRYSCYDSFRQRLNKK